MDHIKLLQNPSLVYIGKLSEKPDWNFPSHRHDDLSEIVYILGGEGDFIIDDQPYLVQQGDLLIYNKGIFHEEKSSKNNPLKTYYCGIADIHIEGLPEGYITPMGTCPLIKQNKYSEQMEKLFSMMFEESSLKLKGYDDICKNLLRSMIIYIQRMAQLEEMKTKNDSETLALQIKEFLDKNYLKQLTLEEIALEFHMNAYYLSHVFKNHYNDSPINYMIYRRMGEAKKLLINTDMKVREISQLVGYENANYFSRIFAKTMGESPLQYKKNEKKERVNLK
ncbi:AraC family transcriptional regulator [Niallia oryzisoli]|uniref:AraC family transcriptional regulator n=1 Tax=Niallia oryzisoli TaxID=1737571 RepID=A0ABZ2C9J5_9BACI